MKTLFPPSQLHELPTTEFAQALKAKYLWEQAYPQVTFPGVHLCVSEQNGKPSYFIAGILMDPAAPRMFTKTNKLCRVDDMDARGAENQGYPYTTPSLKTVLDRLVRGVPLFVTV